MCVCVCVCVCLPTKSMLVCSYPSLFASMVKFGATTGSLLYCRLSQPKIEIS